MRFKDGTLATALIALCEVQGYVYNAKMRMSQIFRRLGNNEKVDKLRAEAQALKGRFNRDFWLEDDLFFAEALDKDKNQVDSITSNAGRLLWSGIVEEEKAKPVVEQLLSEDMFSGWGIRTLSSRSVGYNPLSYHNGSVWPHDNSLIATGLFRYGFFDEARRICSLMLQAASYFPEFRLPELFCGFPRDESLFPVEYPTSSSP